jgi:transposase-like protein
MPFSETHAMDQRLRFVQEAQCSLKSLAELCRRYEISRKTAYKWLERWISEGPEGLHDRGSRPVSSPNATPPEVVEAILEVRRKHTSYGAKKVTWYLERNRPELELPSRRPFTTSCTVTGSFPSGASAFAAGTPASQRLRRRSRTPSGPLTSRVSS